MIKKGTFDYPSPHWDQISDMAKDLISKILVVDTEKRLDSDGILAHTWMVGEKTPRKQLPHVTDKIREFNAKRKFRVCPYIMIRRRNSPWSLLLPRRSRCSSRSARTSYQSNKSYNDSSPYSCLHCMLIINASNARSALSSSCRRYIG